MILSASFGGEKNGYTESVGVELSEIVNSCSSCGEPVGKGVKEEFYVSSKEFIEKIEETIQKGKRGWTFVNDE